MFEYFKKVMNLFNKDAVTVGQLPPVVEKVETVVVAEVTEVAAEVVAETKAVVAKVKKARKAKATK